MKFVKNKPLIFLICIFIYIGNSFPKNELGIEKITITPSMKKNILRSSLNESLQKSDGTTLVVYLYAEDEVSEEQDNYARFTDEITTTISKSGHYYIYLYDIKTDNFLPYRTPVFSGFGTTTFNVEGANLMVLSGSKQKKSDVLFISQYAGSYVDVYEAYGFSENGLYLKNYLFAGKKKGNQFGGLTVKGKKADKINAAIVHNGIPNYILNVDLYLSKDDGEITVQFLNHPPKDAEPPYYY